MSHEQNNDAFIWENQSWATLSNTDIPESSNNANARRGVVVTEPNEEKEKEEEEEEQKEMEIEKEKKEKGKGKGNGKGKEKMEEDDDDEEEEEGKGKKRGRSVVAKNGVVIGEKKKGVSSSDHEMHIWTERQRRKKMRNMFLELRDMLPEHTSKSDKSTIVDEAVNYIRSLQSTLQRLQNARLNRIQVIRGSSNRLPNEPSVAATSRLASLASRETFMADQISALNINGNTNNNSNNNAMMNNNNHPGSSSTNNNVVVHSASASHLPAVIQTWTSSNVVLNICGNDAQFAVYAPRKPGLFSAIINVLEKYNLEVTTAHISTDADRSIFMIHARVGNGAMGQFPDNTTVEEIFKQAAGEMMIWVAP